MTCPIYPNLPVKYLFGTHTDGKMDVSSKLIRLISYTAKKCIYTGLDVLPHVPHVTAVLEVTVDCLTVCTLCYCDRLKQFVCRFSHGRLVTCPDNGVLGAEQPAHFCSHPQLLAVSCGDGLGDSDNH